MIRTLVAGMTEPGGFHRTATTLMSAAMTVIGVALLAQSIAAGAGIVSGRLLLGVLFLAAGLGRSYVEIRRGRRA